MKILILMFLFSFSSVFATCETDPAKNYAAEYGTDPSDVILNFEQDLSGKGFNLYLLASKSSCGAKSCEYGGYVKDTKGCFSRVISFTGSFELGKMQASGLKSLIIKQFIENGKIHSCEWHYQPMFNKMVQFHPTCRFQERL